MSTNEACLIDLITSQATRGNARATRGRRSDTTLPYDPLLLSADELSGRGRRLHGLVTAASTGSVPASGRSHRLARVGFFDTGDRLSVVDPAKAAR